MINKLDKVQAEKIIGGAAGAFGSKAGCESHHGAGSCVKRKDGQWYRASGGNGK